MESKRVLSFHYVDYIVFSVTLVVSIIIGVYYAFTGGRQRTTEEYLVGNRQMSVLPVAISLMVSFESAIMMIGVPAEVYMYGFIWIWGEVGLLIADLISIKLIVPLIHQLPITSVYEYLELRFKSHSVRLLGTALGILIAVVKMGIVLFAPALALEAVTGFPIWSSIIVVSVAAVFNTSIGGLKAVIWTDVFQSVIMFSGVFAVLIKGTIKIGGVGKTFEIAKENGRLNVFNFDPDPRVRHTFWNLVFSHMMTGMGFLFNQSSVQRIISIPTVEQAKRVIWITTPAFFVSVSFAALEGIVAYSYYHTLGCDPLASKHIRNPNQILPYMVMDIFSGFYGMPGLFLAALFCASLSSLSSDLSSLSALLLTDIIRPHCKPMSDIKATIIAKISVIGFGVLIFAIAFLVSMIGGTLTQIASTIVSAFSGPLEGLFLLACFVPYSNATGAITGTVISAIYCFWFAFGKSSSSRASRTQPLPPAPTNMCLPTNLTNGLDWLFDNSTDMLAKYTEYSTTALPVNQPELQGIDQMYSLSYLWIGPIGIIIVLVVGSVVSVCTGPTKVEDRDPRYLVPIFDELFCCLPESWRKHLRFGVDYSKRKDLENQKGNRSGDICNYTTIIEKNDGNGDPNQNYTVDSEKNKQTKETSDVTDTNSDDNESNEINDSNKAKNE